MKIIQWKSGNWEDLSGGVIAEKPVSLTVNGEIWLSFLCTPVDLDSLAVGFLFNENLIQTADELASVRVCPTLDNVDVWVNHAVERPAKWRRTSGCASGITAERADEKIETGSLCETSLNPEQITNLAMQLLDKQDLYRQVGGVHTSALSDGQLILLSAEDVGRHNTLDKIAGMCLLNQIDPPQRVLLTTGRISSEMIQKAARLKASVVISRSSPTTLSIEHAEKLGVTLIGYAHRERFNIYTHPERVI